MGNQPLTVGRDHGLDVGPALQGAANADSGESAETLEGLRHLRIALAHDYLLVMRGAERCFSTLCDLWPTAPVATLLYDPDVFGARLAGHRIFTSRLQRLGLKQGNFKTALPVLPMAAERLDVSGHDVVLSSSSAFAHGVRPDSSAAHVCYCYTPFRYAWYERELGLASTSRWLRPLVSRSLDRIREWDLAASRRGTKYVAISKLSQERIARYWDIEAPIVYPPVELDRFSQSEPEDYLLIVCELVCHKQVEVALEAARRAHRPVKVVGSGPEEAKLRATFGDQAEFLGRVDDARVAELYSRALALVVPNVEEFGISAVEAQAAGRPVIAAGAGGALETVIDGDTGAFFRPGDVDELTSVLSDPALERFSPVAARRNAARFSTRRFQNDILSHVLTAAQMAGVA